MSQPSAHRFRSANVHITGACNYSCGFCFARNLAGMTMGFEEWKPIFEDLRYNRGIDKINFAGGEPLLHPELLRCCKFCKSIGFTVSIVSNGSLIDREFLEKATGCVDWIGLSIDSTNEDTEVEAGRCDGCENRNHIGNILEVSRMAHEFGIKVKLNITVIRQSYWQDFSDIIRITDPERVKVFQVMKLEGHNEDRFDRFAVTPEQFEQFVERHQDIRLRNGLNPVFERTDDIVDSYLMLDPLGSVMRNSGNVYRTEPYGEFMAKGAEKVLDVEKYIRRGGDYDWASASGYPSASKSFRIAVFGVTRSGKDTAIKRAVELTSERYGIPFVHIPLIGTMRRISEDVLSKDLDDTTQEEKGLLMAKYRELISDRSKYPYVITDEHYCYPTTYGGKELHNAYTDAKFPYTIQTVPDTGREYEVMFEEEFLGIYDLVFYMDTPSEKILQRIRNSEPPKDNPFITTEDLDAWKAFERTSILFLSKRYHTTCIIVSDDSILPEEIAEEFGEAIQLEMTRRGAKVI